MISAEDAVVYPLRSAPRSRVTAWRRYFIGLAVAVVAGTTSLRLAHAASDQDLLGAVVNGREVATFLVMKRDGRLWLPLEAFAKATGIESPEKAAAAALQRLSTPLGEVVVPADRLFAEDGVVYVDEAFLKERLNFRFEYDKAAATLSISPAWSGARRVVATDQTLATLKPEALPPLFGVATIHGRLALEQAGTSAPVFNNLGRISGFGYDGVWQLAYADDLYGNRQVRDFAWMRQLDDKRIVQLGHQTLALHPLLPAQEFTGVQYAWSSRSLEAQPGSYYPGSLLQRWGVNQRSFAGRGPVGGFAELWLDDRMIDRRDIGLDGTYAFRDVPLAGRQARVEVRVFDARDPRTPVSVVDRTVELSELLLDADQTTVIASAGYGGNAFDNLTSAKLPDSIARGPIGLALARHGISNDLTIEGAARLTETTQTALAGISARLAPNTYANGSVAIGSGGNVGYDLGGSTGRDRWRLMVNSFRSLQETDTVFTTCSATLFRDRCSEVKWLNEARLSYQMLRDLEVGMIARQDNNAAFILPYFTWHPSPAFSAKLRPDNYGDYRLDAAWRATAVDSFLAAAAYDAASLSYTRLFRDTGMSLTLSGGYDFIADEIEALVALSGRHLAGLELDWRVALVGSPSGLGVETSLRRKLYPGVYGFLDASSGHQHRSTTERLFGTREDLRFRVGIGFDLAVANDGSVIAANSNGVRPDVGNVAGIVAPAAARSGADLAGIPILIDGQIVGRTASDGSFFIPDVRRGVRTVEFEEDKLPLEHVAKKRAFVAQVSPGAVTSMTFETEILYGVAGRITASGAPVSNVAVIIVDTASKKVAGRAASDAFGYYRIDDLAAGRYEVRAMRADGKSAAAIRAVAIAGDFVLDADLAVPPQ